MTLSNPNVSPLLTRRSRASRLGPWLGCLLLLASVCLTSAAFGQTMKSFVIAPGRVPIRIKKTKQTPTIDVNWKVRYALAKDEAGTPRKYIVITTSGLGFSAGQMEWKDSRDRGYFIQSASVTVKPRRLPAGWSIDKYAPQSANPNVSTSTTTGWSVSASASGGVSDGEPTAGGSLSVSYSQSSTYSVTLPTFQTVVKQRGKGLQTSYELRKTGTGQEYPRDFKIEGVFTNWLDTLPDMAKTTLPAKTEVVFEGPAQSTDKITFDLVAKLTVIRWKIFGNEVVAGPLTTYTVPAKVSRTATVDLSKVQMPGSVVSKTPFNIVSHATGKVLGTAGGIERNGARLQTLRRAGSRDMQFQLLDAGDNADGLKRIVARKSRLSLTPAGNRSGAPLVLARYRDLDRDHFRIESLSGGLFRIVCVRTDLCLTELPDGRVVQAKFKNNPRQQWRFRPASR